MEFLDLPQLISASGTVRLPGSKSISNRVLLLAALAEGGTEVRDLLASDDTARMLDALTALGVGVTALGGGNWLIKGCGGVFPVRQAELYLGNAGTAFRPLTAALALAGGDYVLKGVARMHERPIGDLVDGLRQLGADIDYLGNEGFPPLHLKPATSYQLCRWHGAGAWRRFQPVPDGFVDGVAADGRDRHGRRHWGADFQALYRDHAGDHGAFWGAGRARWLAALYRPGGQSLSVAGNDLCGR